MIYDCFLLNEELDLLELRLNYLNALVDKFVIVESAYTFSGIPKPLHFGNNTRRFARFLSKINYITDTAEPDLTSAWVNEYHQRNLIKTGLKSANHDDLIIISDLDEIPYLNRILDDFQLDIPQRIPMSLSYYFLNGVQPNETWSLSVITPFRFIKNVNIGNRDALINDLNIKLNYSGYYGGHFAYLFGNDINRYINKIKSFSHQEYNTNYYLNPNRIKYCINNGIDLYERNMPRYNNATQAIDEEVLKFVSLLDLNHLLKSQRSVPAIIRDPKEFFFLIKVGLKTIFHRINNSIVRRLAR
ncbi:MAG TPA: hypothetical protein VNW95_13895 [Mucilaginibacter sp.]|jgi:hypothetical protein|nr:hypothetical protein [Mucilaginibacter sp.]